MQNVFSLIIYKKKKKTKQFKNGILLMLYKYIHQFLCCFSKLSHFSLRRKIETYDYYEYILYTIAVYAHVRKSALI